MDASIIRENWNEIKTLIRSKWSRLPEQEIEAAKENLGQLEASVRKFYGSTKEKAECEFKEFKMSMRDHLKRKEPPPAHPPDTF